MSIKVTQKGIENASLEHQKRQKLGRRSRNKGSNFERDIAKKFKAHYGFELVRTPQSGGFAKKSAKADDFRGDIVPADEDLVLNLHIEAKCHKKWDVPDWIRQSESDCPEGKIPVVVFHKSGTSKDYIVFSVEHLFRLLGSAPPADIVDPTLSTSEEVWKPIYGFENYLISNKGLIKNSSGSLLHPSVGSSGYYNTSLRRDGKTFSVRVHQLVARNFLQLPDSKACVVNHIDGNKLNNCVENLEYVSSGVNNQKAYDTGLKPKGENHRFAKLSDKDCFDIRVSYLLSGNSVKTLTEKYSISETTVRRLVDLPEYRNPFNLYILCKNSKSWSLPSWFAQAESDCPKGKKPCVIFHKHGTSKDYIALSLEDFFKLVPAENIAYLKSGGAVK